MSDTFSPPEEPQLVGKKWDDKLARNIQDFLRKVRQSGNQIPRHASTHMVGGGDALPIDKLTKKGDLLTKTPYGLLTATDLLDNFTDGDYTSSPVWTPYVAANVAVTANRLVTTARCCGGSTIPSGFGRFAGLHSIAFFAASISWCGGKLFNVQ